MINVKCDHLLGILNSYGQTDENNLNFNNFVKKLHKLSDNSSILADLNIARTQIFPKTYIDRRSNYATLYNYCPYCGIKINWKKMRKMLDK